VNAKDNTVQSAYLISTSEGYLELLNLTLKHGGDLDSKDFFNGTGLIRAADRGHADIAGRLVQAGVKINHINNLGWTALHEAIILGDGSGRYVDTVRVLVAGGADLRLPSQRDKISPIEHAAAKGHNEITQVLRTALGADKPLKGRADQRLLAAAERGDATAAALAVRAGADIETRDARGRTPLLLAATEDRLAVARLLVYLGADPDALDDHHDTPWLVTGVTGSVDMLEVLLPAGPDYQPREQPRLDRSLGGGDLGRRVEALPADRDDTAGRWRGSTARGPEGVTPLQHAIRRGQGEVATILRNA